MTQAWKGFQGQLVNGKFPLSQYLGGSDHSAVFLTTRPQGEPRKAAIKLTLAAPGKAERQLSRWTAAAKMSHPHLLRLFEMGRCRLGELSLLYLVMEYAEEDLSQVVATRALTPGECQQMLPPVLDALGYIHRQGFVHGHIKPANIMAAQEQVKISSDGLFLPGESSAQLGVASVYDPPETATEGMSPAADVWSLGMSLVEVLTRKVPVLHAGRTEPLLPPSVPRPLADLVRHCLRLDRAQRWTVSDIAARLAPATPLIQPVQVSPNQQGSPIRTRYVVAAVVLAVLLLAVFIGLRNSQSEQSTPPAAQAASPEPVSSAAAPVATSPVAAKIPARPAARNAVVHEVIPRVPQSARDTIQGTIRVRVRVALDQDGNVASARFVVRGPSRYFARLSMQAAQAWKFTPASPDDSGEPREWLLVFHFRRDSTRVFPNPISR